MKTKALLLFCYTLITSGCFATHYRAGEITYKVTGPLQVEASVIIYTKVSGPSNLANRDTVVITWGDGLQSTISRTNGPIGLSGFPQGVMVAADILQSVFTGIHTYAVPPPNNFYVLSFSDQNRMSGITNIDGGNSVNVPFYIESSVSFPPGNGLNASPVFLNPPIYYANVNDTFNFNSVPYDANGDSMSFEYIAPLQATGTAVPVYSFPDQFCQFNGQINASLQIGSTNGQIIWSPPCQQGIYDVATLVKEYRCGVLIGTIERDMVIIALGESNSPPHISSLSDAILQPGQSFHFNVTASDPDNGQVDSLFILGGPMLDSVNAPVFLAVNGNPATGAFNWTTGASFARQQPYIFSIIALDNYRFSVDSTPAGLIDCKTFRVWVTDTAASACALSNINEVQSNTFSIFPNPASTELSIVTDGQRPSLISVYNFSGQKIMEQGFAPQLHISQLSQGIYFVEITANGNITRKKFVKL